MELKYCESCGAPVQVDPAAQTDFLQHFQCPRCLGTSGSASVPVARPPDDSSADDSHDALAFLDGLEGDSGGGISEELDLFSGRSRDSSRPSSSSPAVSIELGRGKTTTAERGPAAGDQGRPPSGFKVVDRRTGSSHGAFSTTPLPPPPPPPPPPDDDDDDDPYELDEDLTLFSPETVRLRREDLEFLDEATPELNVDQDDDALNIPPNPGGSATPAPTATRIQFLCIECRSRLVVRPVKKLSKMVCPRCSKRMFVDPEGKVTDEPPADMALDKSIGGTIVPNLRRKKSADLFGDSDADETERLEPTGVDKLLEQKAAELDQLRSSDEDDLYDDDDPARLPGGGGSPDPGDLARRIAAELADPERSEFSAPPPPAEPPPPINPFAQGSRSGISKHAARGIQLLSTLEPPWKALLHAFGAGLLLAAPLLVLTYLTSPAPAAESERSAVERALEATGRAVERGLERVVDGLGRVF